MMIKLTGLVDLKPLREFYADDESDPNSQDPQAPMANMVRPQLMQLYKHASALFNMIGETETVDPWIEEKVKIASEELSTVYNQLQYEKNGPASIGDGMGSPANAEREM